MRTSHRHSIIGHVVVVVVLACLIALRVEARAQALVPGSEVVLWSPTHKRYMRMEVTGYLRASVATYPGASPVSAALLAERFRVVDAGGGKVALYSAVHRRFVRITAAGEVDSASQVDALPGSWTAERFTIATVGTNRRFTVNSRILMMDAAGDMFGPGIGTASKSPAWGEFQVVVTAPPPPPGWEFSPGRPGMPAVLLIHGLAASSYHFTNPLKAWNVANTHYDHDRPVTAATGTSSLPRVGLLAVEGSGNDPQSNPETSMWAYLVDQGFTVATWDQAPCIEAGTIPVATCFDSDTFDNAYKTAPQALAKLASLTSEDIVLVGHSRGGLIVRRLLKDTALPGRSQVKTAITIHTPHQGTGMAGKGVEVQNLFTTLQTSVTGAVPAGVADVVNPLLSPILATPNGIIERLVTTVGLKGARELAPGGPIYTALTSGESKPAGVKVYTFGGTSVNLWRLHAWVYTAASATPGNGFEARPTQLVALPDAFPSPFPEMQPGVGDLLVTDTSSKLVWEDQHFTNPLNHGEVLWSRGVHRKVHELVLGIILPPEPSTRTAYAPAVGGSAEDVLAWVKELPVIKQLGGAVTAVASGEFVTLNTSVSGVTLEAFAGPEGWHVAAGFSTSSQFELGSTITDRLGDVNLTSVAVVVAKAADVVPKADLPPSIASKVTDFTGDGTLALRAGVNVFATVTPSDTGVIGVVKGALGLGSGPIKLSGSICSSTDILDTLAHGHP